MTDMFPINLSIRQGYPLNHTFSTGPKEDDEGTMLTRSSGHRGSAVGLP